MSFTKKKLPIQSKFHKFKSKILIADSPLAHFLSLSDLAGPSWWSLSESPSCFIYNEKWQFWLRCLVACQARSCLRSFCCAKLGLIACWLTWAKLQKPQSKDTASVLRAECGSYKTWIGKGDHPEQKSDITDFESRMTQKVHLNKNCYITSS